MDAERKRIRNYLIKIGCIAVISCVVLWLLGLGVLPRQSYIKSQYYEFYNGGNYDTLFVGSSLVYRSINPDIVDELTGSNAFNLGTSAQKPIDSYYVIKDAIRTQNVKTIVLDVSQSFYLNSPYTTQNKSTYLIYDRMENSPVKREYFLNAFDVDNYPFALFTVSHYDVPSWGEFRKNLVATLSSGGEPERIVYSNEWYAGRGFVPSIQVYDGNADIIEYQTGISEDAIGWLRKTITLCQENGIQLIVVSSPKTEENNKGINHYTENYEYINGVLAEYGLHYYDFSLMEEYSVFTNECFVDAAHLNEKGATLYSKMIADIINSQ